MADTALVIGATGGFGQAMARALTGDGWQVTALMRHPRPLPAGLEAVSIMAGDARNAADMRRAAAGADVIVQGFNVPYPRWWRDWPRANRAAMAAAAQTGATILFPGNIYNYGRGDGLLLSEDTAQNPQTRKGALRKRLEGELAADARAGGYRAIVLRASDYFGPDQRGGWFGEAVTKDLAKGIVTDPGGRDMAHSWAYLPDLAAAGLGLLKARQTMSGFETFHFRGLDHVTGHDLFDAIRAATGRDDLKTRPLPWKLIRLLGLVMPMMAEIREMRWLWQCPHTLDDAKLRRVLPDLQTTPLDVAVRTTLAAQGKIATSGHVPSGYAVA